MLKVIYLRYQQLKISMMNQHYRRYKNIVMIFMQRFHACVAGQHACRLTGTSPLKYAICQAALLDARPTSDHTFFHTSCSQIHPRAVYSKPFFAVAVIGQHFVNLIPERLRVVHVSQVCQLMHHDVVDDR